MNEKPLSILQVLEKGSFTTGSVVQMFELARGLARRGHRVGVVSRPDGDVARKSRDEAIPFYPLRFSHEFDLASARQLARIIDEVGADVVHVHKGIAHSAALFATLFVRRRPVLVVNRGVSFPVDFFAGLKYHARLDAVVTVCEDIKRVVVASARIPARKVHVVYAGVDLARFDPSRVDVGKVRREWGVAPAEEPLDADDRLIDGARQLSAALTQKHVAHEFKETVGNHSWPVWRRYLGEFLPLIFTKTKPKEITAR